jgi:hypothetical protein
MAFEKGHKRYGGKIKGQPNKVTTQFKEALNNLLETAAPSMVEWLEKIAEDDPARALDLVSKLAEYVHPKLARSEIEGRFDGKFSVSWEE